MTDMPPSAIVHTDCRPKRARKRKQSPPIPQWIVSAKQPKPTGPAIDDVVVSPRRQAAQAAAISVPRIFPASQKRSTRFGPGPDFDGEHARRGGAAVALFKEFARRARAMPGRKPERYCRSYGDDPQPTGAEAMDEPFAAFPSWKLRIRCDRCGKDRFLVETHFDRRDMLLREIIKRIRQDGRGGHGARAELMTGVEGVTSRPVRRIALMEG